MSTRFEDYGTGRFSKQHMRHLAMMRKIVDRNLVMYVRPVCGHSQWLGLDEQEYPNAVECVQLDGDEFPCRGQGGWFTIWVMDEENTKVRTK